MSAQLRVGDIGTVLSFLVRARTPAGVAPMNISDATTKTLRFKKPDGVVVDKPGVFDTDGIDGLLTYTTVSGDLDQEGPWQAQAIIVQPAGAWKSSFASFHVGGNL